VSPKTLANWVEAGKLKAYRTVGGHRRVQVGDLNEFLGEMGMPLVDEGPPADTAAADSGRRKILVVDDDEIIVETIVLALEEDDHDYEVISAADGFEAGLQISRVKPHLVLLDIMMPDINGYEVCRRLKGDTETADIKVVVLSAYLDDDSYARMREYGADACFSKPLPLEKLKGEIARLLGLEGDGGEGDGGET
jgi:excisionase family DNA binding protein